MKRFFHMMIVAIVAITACCACSKVNDIDKRLGVLENIVSDLKAQISAGAVITSVDKTSDGCTFTLSNGQTYTVTNGKDGADGTDGEAIIADVKIEEDFVVLTLKNGETLRISYQNPLSMVTLNIVPDYDDGTVREPNTTEFNGEESTIFYLDVAVTPAKYAEILSDTERFIHKAVFSPVQTKSGFGNAFTVSPKSVTYAEGAPVPFLEASFELDEETVAALESTPYTVSYSIEDKDKVHGASTAFVPLNNEAHSGWISSDDLANGGMAIEVGGHQVTVKCSNEDGIADDLFLNVTSNGSTVIIKSLTALTGRFIQCTCTPAGKATCTPSIDATTGICTFTITNVQDDITAEVSYLKCNVTVEYDSDMGVVKLNGVAVASGSPVQILYGEEAEFTAEANTGYGFLKWTDGSDKDLSTDNPYKFTVSQSASYVAVFKLKDALSGVFSVSGNKKVQFSKGNLYYNGTTFNFEANQYDTTPSSNGARVENHISHFMWCADATNAMELKYESGWYGENTSFFAAKNFTVNGYSGWGVLTGGANGEWAYLLNTRKTIYGKDTDVENRRYAAVKVNGMAGLLIFPDDFSSWPSEAGNEPQTFNNNSSNWNDRNYTVEQFTVLQNNGCVFLPAAGFRFGDPGRQNPADVLNVGDYGYYWSASPNDDNLAYDLNFRSGFVTPNHLDPRNRAQSVRLVTESK